MQKTRLKARTRPREMFGGRVRKHHPGRLVARVVQHVGGGVNPSDANTSFGEPPQPMTGAAADFEHAPGQVGGWTKAANASSTPGIHALQWRNRQS